jgi:chromosome segregation ATPase
MSELEEVRAALEDGNSELEKRAQAWSRKEHELDIQLVANRLHEARLREREAEVNDREAIIKAEPLELGETKQAIKELKQKLEEQRLEHEHKRAEWEKREQVWKASRSKVLDELRSVKEAYIEKGAEMERKNEELRDKEINFQQGWAKVFEERLASWETKEQTWEETKRREENQLDARWEANKLQDVSLRKREAEVNDRESRIKAEALELKGVRQGVKELEQKVEDPRLEYEAARCKEIGELRTRMGVNAERSVELDRRYEELSDREIKVQQRWAKFKVERKSCEQTLNSKEERLKGWEEDLVGRERIMSELDTQVTEGNEITGQQKVMRGTMIYEWRRPSHRRVAWRERRRVVQKAE